MRLSFLFIHLLLLLYIKLIYTENALIKVVYLANHSVPVSLVDSRVPKQNVSVAIVGAGFTGLAAYRKLLELGFQDVHIFEASGRAGGRVFPIKYDGIYLQQGAEFINGINNHIYRIANHLRLIVGELDDIQLIAKAKFESGAHCTIPQEMLKQFHGFTQNLERKYSEMSREGSANWNISIGDVYRRDYDDFVVKLGLRTRKEKSIYDALSKVYKSYFEGEWAADIEKLALHNYARWNDHSESFSFASFTLNSHGYKPIMDHMLEGISNEQLHLNSKVFNINFEDRTTHLVLEGKGKWSKAFDYVIVTIPIGHLKQYATSLFTPSLPRKKLQAIEAIGFGVVQKLFLIYERPFWDSNSTSIITLYIDGCSEPVQNKSLLQNLHTFQPHPWNPKILVGWLSGEGPGISNTLSDTDLIEELTNHFRHVMPDRTIERPSKIFRKKWLEDDLFRGSYSYITPKATNLAKDPFALLNSPVYDRRKKARILFAGEGTHTRMYQTTIGAFLSGVREAERIHNYVNGVAKNNCQ